LTLFSLELHVRTRRDARPDPEFDSIRAIFYYIQTDTSLASGKNKITGIICVDSESFKICNSKTGKFTLFCVEQQTLTFLIVFSLLKECSFVHVTQMHTCNLTTNDHEDLISESEKIRMLLTVCVSISKIAEDHPKAFEFFQRLPSCRRSTNDCRIERFHSRGQQPCKFIGTKESVYIRKEFNSRRIGLGRQHGRHFIGCFP